MPNMSHCRFENTYKDLEDCYNRMDDDLSDTEKRYQLKLLELCRNLVDDYEHLG